MEIHTTDITNPDLDFSPDVTRKFYEVEPRLRMDYKDISPNAIIRNARDAVHYLADTIYDCPQEHCYSIFLNSALHPIGYTCVGTGSTGTTPVSFSKIVQTALLLNATGIILLHNHPSCSYSAPTDADIQLAKNLSYVLKLLDGMVLYDSIIISGNHIYNMASDKSLAENPTQPEPILTKNIAAQ